MPESAPRAPATPPTCPVSLATPCVLGGFGKINFKPYGGVAQVDSAGAYIVGATGKIKFTTLGAMPNSGYTVIMRGTKGVPQS